MASNTITIDPVCGMAVDPRSAIAVDYSGARYHFCESACAETFREDPKRWVRPEGGRQPSAADS
jgi:Cu+-exporting ATPase